MEGKGETREVGDGEENVRIPGGNVLLLSESLLPHCWAKVIASLREHLLSNKGKRSKEEK